MTYDQWKTTPPEEWYGHEDAPREFECEACRDQGWVVEWYDEAVIPCPECSGALNVYDLEDWVPPNQVGCADGRDDSPEQQQSCGVPGQADPRAAR